MNTTTSDASYDSYNRHNIGTQEIATRSTVSWGAIFAGATAALALQVLFMMLGTGLGMAIYSPDTADDPVANLSMGALIIQCITALVSLCLGGWVAGRFAPVHARATGWLHGFTVWCAATVGGVIMVALGASALLGGLTKVVGGGLSAVGESTSSVAGGVANLATEAWEQTDETITSYVDESVSNLPEDVDAGEKIRATREVGLALGRLFNPMQESNTEANREEAAAALVEHTKMSEAEANSSITDWTASYERLQTDLAEFQDNAAEQAGEAADTVADALATSSLWAFAAFLLGALAATGGGYLGAVCATRCDETVSDHRDSTYDD